MKNILNDRILWYDGHITFTPDQLVEFILNGGYINHKIHVNSLNEEITKFNELNPYLTLNIKKDLEHLNTTWNVPEAYQKLAINKYIHDKFLNEIDKKEQMNIPLSDTQVDNRIDRIKLEMDLFKKYDMYVILRTIIYILDVFKQNGVIWGTGRGSSCASYVLYLLGLHNVDSVEYDIDLTEFFKEKVNI